MPPPQAHNTLRAQVKWHQMPNTCTQGSPTALGFKDNHLKTIVANTSTAYKGKWGCLALLAAPGKLFSHPRGGSPPSWRGRGGTAGRAMAKMRRGLCSPMGSAKQ